MFTYFPQCLIFDKLTSKLNKIITIGPDGVGDRETCKKGRPDMSIALYGDGLSDKGSWILMLSCWAVDCQPTRWMNHYYYCSHHMKNDKLIDSKGI